MGSGVSLPQLPPGPFTEAECSKLLGDDVFDHKAFRAAAGDDSTISREALVSMLMTSSKATTISGGHDTIQRTSSGLPVSTLIGVTRFLDQITLLSFRVTCRVLDTHSLTVHDAVMRNCEDTLPYVLFQNGGGDLSKFSFPYFEARNLPMPKYCYSYLRRSAQLQGGYTPLGVLCERPSLPPTASMLCSQLLIAGADPNRGTRACCDDLTFLFSPLGLLCSRNTLDRATVQLADLVLKAGADPDLGFECGEPVVGCKGFTPLGFLCQRADLGPEGTHLVMMLLAHGADPKARSATQFSTSGMTGILGTPLTRIVSPPVPMGKVAVSGESTRSDKNVATTVVMMLLAKGASATDHEVHLNDVPVEGGSGGGEVTPSKMALDALALAKAHGADRSIICRLENVTKPTLPPLR